MAERLEPLAMIRPWYRSRLFWLGLFGLVFGLWLWWDSMHHSTTFWVSWEGRPDGSVFGPPHRGFSLGSERGSLWFGWNEDPFWPMPSQYGLGFQTSRYLLQDLLLDPFAPAEEAHWEYSLRDWFPTPLGTGNHDPFAPAGSHAAIWFLLFGYLIAWGSVSAIWRSWKARRAAKIESMVETEPEGS